MKIIGFTRSVGTYEGYDYDNYCMHCIDSARSDMIAGDGVTVVKIKVSEFWGVFEDFVDSVFGGDIPDDADIMRELVGKNCKVLYDRRGKYAADVRIISKQENTYEKVTAKDELPF